MIILQRAADYFGEPWTDVEDDFIVSNNGYVIGRITLYPQLEANAGTGPLPIAGGMRSETLGIRRTETRR